MEVPDCFRTEENSAKIKDLLEGKIKKPDEIYGDDDEIAFGEVTYFELTPKRLDSILIPDDKIVKAEVSLKGRGEFEYHNRPSVLNNQETCLITCYSALGASKKEASFLFQKIKRIYNIKHKIKIEKIEKNNPNKYLGWYFKANFVIPPLKKQDLRQALANFKYKEAEIVYKQVTKGEFRNSHTGGPVGVNR